MRKQRRRIIWIALGLFSLFALLILQFYYLQIIQEKKWVRAAAVQHCVAVKEPFKRGVFYSNVDIKEGHPAAPVPFVVDVPKFHLFIDPMVIPQGCRNEIAQKISEILKLPTKARQYARAQFDKKARSRKLISWISNEQQTKVDRFWRTYARKHKIAKNALYFVREYKRSYPYGKLLGQVLHTVRDDRDVVTKQSLPTGGLEMQFDEYLRGKEGKRVIERSPKRSMDTTRVISEPEDGADVHLTINHYLQALAEEQVEKGVKQVGAKGGWAVVMDPQNGDILAIAQYPFFEPANYRDYYNDPEKVDSTRIKAISECYEPGSTFKAITVAIGLMANKVMEDSGKEPLFDPEEMVATSDGTLPGRRPLKDVRLHNYLNMNLAIQKSSNIYMAKLIQKVIDNLGIQWYRDQLQHVFGIGERTQINLPYENRGFLPTPGKTYPNGALQWSIPTPYSLAIGYNVLANSMQMLRAFSVFASGGYLVEPHLVKKIVKQHRNGSQEVLKEVGVTRRRVMDEKIANRVVEAMKYVTKSGGGATRANIHGYTQAGKTSTSEKLIEGTYSKTVHFTSFVGFAPAKNPRVLISIGIDEPESRYVPGHGRTHYGGKSAAPIFREIARLSLEYLGVPLDDPYGYPQGDPRFDEDKADWMLECKTIRKLYNEWNK